MCQTQGRSDQALKLYCKTCEMTNSSYCTKVDHRNHASDEKSNLKKILDEVKQRSIEFTDRAFNGNDVQILSMKKYILKCLENLKTAKDQIEPCVKDRLKFIVPYSVEDIDCHVLQLHSLDDSVFCPEFSTADFKEPGTLKPGKKAVITVNCRDQYRTRMNYGG